MKIQEGSKPSDWFQAWYKSLQRDAPVPSEDGEIYGWSQSALELINKMLARMQRLEVQ